MTSYPSMASSSSGKMVVAAGGNCYIVEIPYARMESNSMRDTNSTKFVETHPYHVTQPPNSQIASNTGRSVSAKKSIGKLHYYCKFLGCKNAYYSRITDLTHQNKRFHKFPSPISQPELHRKWREACRVPPNVGTKYSFVCGDHFEDSDYACPTRESFLKHNSVPKNRSHLHASNTINQIAQSDDTSSVVSDVDDSSEDVIRSARHNDHSYCKVSPSLEAVMNSGNNLCDESFIGSLIHDMVPSDEIISPVLPSPKINLNLNKVRNTSVKRAIRRNLLWSTRFNPTRMTPRPLRMYKIHTQACSHILKFKKSINAEDDELSKLRRAYANGDFDQIKKDLNKVQLNFINKQLRSSKKKSGNKRWTLEDKVFALTISKESPRLYKYFRVYFELPSVQTLHAILSQIPFEAGLNDSMLEMIKIQVEKMTDAEKKCALVLGKVQLKKALFYQRNLQKLYGYADLGHLGRRNILADQAWVFMIRGLKKNFKQLLSYYFTVDATAADDLMKIICHSIDTLKSIGLEVKAVICKQDPTRVRAMRELARETTSDSENHFFILSGEKIFIIYDTPHLLIDTRDCLIRNRIVFDRKVVIKLGSGDVSLIEKSAEMEHIKQAFDLSERQKFKPLFKLSESYFNWSDSQMRCNVCVAAQQLSYRMAATIDTYVMSGAMAENSLHTAEFAHFIDELFDSTNGSTLRSPTEKKYRRLVTNQSGHVDFWNEALEKISQWRICSLEDGSDVTDDFDFKYGWITTIKSFKDLWQHLRDDHYFKSLSPRQANQDPMQNLLFQIQQHDVTNGNLTSFQLIESLKICMMDELRCDGPRKGFARSCEDDESTVLDSMAQFLHDSMDRNENPVTSQDSVMWKNYPAAEEAIDRAVLKKADESDDSCAATYVAGWLLGKISGVHDCKKCSDTMLSQMVTTNHIYVFFNETNEKQKLSYASEKFTRMIGLAHEYCYQFLDQKGFELNLESRFQETYLETLRKDCQFCDEHDRVSDFLQVGVSFLISKYCKDMNTVSDRSVRHNNRIDKFSTDCLKRNRRKAKK